jgi:hypothetical protein
VDFYSNDYRCGVARFLALVYYGAKMNISLLRALLALSIGAVILSGCADDGPATAAWLLVGILFALALGIYVLISGGNHRK